MVFSQLLTVKFGAQRKDWDREMALGITSISTAVEVVGMYMKLYLALHEETGA
jgi:hypothetical protein